MYIYCFVFCLFTNTATSKNIQKKQALNDVIAKYYLNSFQAEKPKEKTSQELEKERAKKVYEVESPKLLERQKAETLLKKVYRKNEGIGSFLKEKKSIAEFPPIVWENMKLFQGSMSSPDAHILREVMRYNASQIEKVAMAMRLVTPITDY